MFRDSWRNRKVAKIAYLAGQGHSAPSIAKQIGEPGAEHLIASMLNEWGFYMNGAPCWLRRPVSGIWRCRRYAAPS